MIVNSRQLENAAATVRKRKRGPQVISAEGVAVSAAQLDTAARILREAEPSVIRSPRRLASTTERPGFIEKAQQEAPDVLTLQVGILPSEIHCIDRKGRIL